MNSAISVELNIELSVQEVSQQQQQTLVQFTFIVYLYITAVEASPILHRHDNPAYLSNIKLVKGARPRTHAFSLSLSLANVIDLFGALEWNGMHTLVQIKHGYIKKVILSSAYSVVFILFSHIIPWWSVCIIKLCYNGV